MRINEIKKPYFKRFALSTIAKITKTFAEITGRYVLAFKFYLKSTSFQKQNGVIVQTNTSMRLINMKKPYHSRR